MVVATSMLPTAATQWANSQNAVNLWHQQRYPNRYQNVAVYGSHATRPGDGYYEHAQRVGAALATSNMGVVTGGGGGSMRAAAEGAVSRGGHTIGMAMSFVGEQPSTDVHREMYHFSNFSDRLDKGFERRSALTAAVPGGIGTLMEITKKVTELSTDKTVLPAQKQVVLFDRNNIFRNFKQYLQDNMVANGLMSQESLDMLKIVDETQIESGIRQLQANGQFTRGLTA